MAAAPEALAEAGDRARARVNDLFHLETEGATGVRGLRLGNRLETHAPSVFPRSLGALT